MTLQQLKYVITVAETGTITEAANRLYVSQPSLTNAIHELEKEMNIVGQCIRGYDQALRVGRIRFQTAGNTDL